MRQLRRYINTKVAESFVHIFISSKLDYCNSLFYDFLLNLVKKTLKIQNIVTRVISYTPLLPHISPVLHVKYKKIKHLNFKCLHKFALSRLNSFKS